jgi:hypothetical protein
MKAWGVKNFYLREKEMAHAMTEPQWKKWKKWDLSLSDFPRVVCAIFCHQRIAELPSTPRSRLLCGGFHLRENSFLIFFPLYFQIIFFSMLPFSLSLSLPHFDLTAFIHGHKSLNPSMGN